MTSTDSTRVRLYTTPTCGYCRAAKALLGQHEVPFEEIDLASQPTLRDELVARHRWPTVPIILADGDLIGGYTELAELATREGLDHLK